MTTILCIRKDNEVVMAGDGQATLGETAASATAKSSPDLPARLPMALR